MKRISLLTLTLLICSCSRFSNPPSDPLGEISKSDDLSSNQKQALVLHRLATNKDLNCKQVKEIITKRNNPIYPWAIGKYVSNCHVSQQEVEYLYKAEAKLPQWAKRSFYQAVSQKSKTHELRIKSSFALLPFLKTQKEKVELLLSLKTKASLEQLKAIDLKLIEVAPRYTKVITPGNIYMVARDFERNRQFTKARKLYTQIIKTSSRLEKIVPAWNRIRMSHKLQRDRKTYLKETRALVLFLEKKLHSSYAKESFAKYATILARIYWTQDNLWRAKKVLRSVLLVPGVPQSFNVEVYYHFAGIYEDLGQKKKAIHYYKKAFSSIQEEHDLKDAIIWNLSWYYYKINNFEQAITWLDKYEAPKEKTRAYRFDFWKAKSLKKLGKTQEANHILNQLRTQDSYGYYGQMAHMETHKLAPISVSTPDFDYDKDPLSWALYIQNYTLAQEIIDTMEEKELAHYYKAQYFDKMIFKYFSYDLSKRKKILGENPIFSYPMAFKDTFIKSNKSQKVSSPLLMAIARQESAFNPVARSPADAFGLLQLIPSQAKRLSKRYDIPYDEFTDLYVPETNIALSSMLLDELMKRQKKNFIHFIASYNAGERPVRRWKKRMKNYSDLEFIEQIPYKETRKYVKLVARNYLIYKRMLSEKEFSLSPSFFRDGIY